MPASIIATVVAQVVVAEIAATVMMSAFLQTALRAVIGFVLSGVIRGAMGGNKPEQSAFSSPSADAKSRTQTIRQPISPRKTIYGEVRTGGDVTYIEVVGSDLWMVITFAGHPVQEICEIQFDDDLVPTDSTGAATGKYAGYATIYKSTGDEGSPQQPFPALVAASAGKWTDAHLQAGCAKIAVKLTQNRSLYTKGIPNITAVIKGKRVIDPRISPTEEVYTDNAALCLNDYLISSSGLGLTYGADIDDSQALASSNTSDEEVLVKQDWVVVTINDATGKISFTSGDPKPRTGDGVRVATASSPASVLPGNLLENTTYYAIRNGDGTISLAASRSDALRGSTIPVGASPASQGEILLTKYCEARYTVNGTLNADSKPKEVIGLLLGAMAGQLINVGGKWFIFAGAYETPTIELDEDDLIGSVRIQSMLSRRESCNGVKGVFTDPNSSWQPTSFPPVASNQYMNEDGGERVWNDIDVSGFVTSGTQAQRLSKISLLQTRQGLSVQAPFRLRAWKAMTGRTVLLTLSKYGIVSKAFDVASTRFVVGSDGSIGVELVLRETAAAIYDWSTDEESTVDVAPNTTLPDALADLSISSLTAYSGTDALLRQGDGTIVPRVRLDWTPPGNIFLAEYEIEHSLQASPTEWLAAPKVLAPANRAYAQPVNDGDVINLRMRAVTSLGALGDWAYVLGHTVVGKTAPPSDVVNAVAYQNGDVVVFGCDEVSDADLDLIEVRWLDYGDTSWANGIPVANILRGQELPSASIPQGNWTFLFKARDTSGNYSDNVTRADLTVTADGYTSISATESSPDWNGTLVGFLVSVSGKLVPDSSLAANAHTNAELFEQYVPYPVAESTFTAAEIDKGIDASVRVYANIVSALGRGVSTGTSDPAHRIDTHLSTDSYDGFEDWSVGTKNFRYLKSRIYSPGLRIVVTGFETTLDARTRTEDGTYTTSAGGSIAVTFSNPFHSAPGLVVSPQGSGNVSASWDNLAGTGFTGYFKTGGAASAGTASYKATGA